MKNDVLNPENGPKSDYDRVFLSPTGISLLLPVTECGSKGTVRWTDLLFPFKIHSP